MPVFEIPRGKEGQEMARARYRAWRRAEIDPRYGMRREIDERNRRRAALNQMSEVQRQEFNLKRLAEGQKPIRWPLRMLVLFSDRCREARRACRLTKTQFRNLEADGRRQF